MKRQISDDAAKSVVSAVDKLCDYVDSGLSPVDAGVKVASERGLSRGQVELVCRSYNNGVVNATRRDGEKLSTKFSVQQYADPDKVNAQVFSTTDKVAADVVADVYKDAAMRMLVIKKKKANPECGSEEKKEDDCDCECDSSKESAEKAERCDCGCGEPKSECKHEEHKSDYAKSKEKMAELTQLKDERRKLANTARGLTSAVHDAFASEISGKFASDKDIADQLAHHHKIAAIAIPGTCAGLLIDQVAERKLSSLWFDHYKTSRESILGKQSQAINVTKGFLGAVKSAVDSLKALDSFNTALPKQAVDISREAHLLLNSSDEPTGLRLPGKTARETEAVVWDKQSSVLSSIIGSSLARLPGVEKSTRPANAHNSLPFAKARLELNDPAHQRELRQLKAEMLLNDLMSRDEILASYSPYEVANAYEDLAASAPAIVNNPVMLQTNLKRMLHGNLMPADARDIVESNREVKSKPVITNESIDLTKANAPGGGQSMVSSILAGGQGALADKGPKSDEAPSKPGKPAAKPNSGSKDKKPFSNTAKDRKERNSAGNNNSDSAKK